MISYARASNDGWRYSFSYRAKKVLDLWEVQKWNGKAWIHVDYFGSYADARLVA